jgi:hypothetical protein
MNVIAATAASATPSIFAPVSTPAFAIRDLSFLVLAVVTCIFLVVAGVRPLWDLKHPDDPDGPHE